MDPLKYTELRRQVINTMNKNASCRGRESGERRRRSSCPEVEIPSHLKKSILSLEKEHVEEIEEHILEDASPKVSPKDEVSRPSLYDFTKGEMMKCGIVLVEK